MFGSHQKSTGTQYTMTMALLIVAFICNPAALMVSRTWGYASVSLALACSALCITFAWVNWKKYSQLTIPSIETPHSRAK